MLRISRFSSLCLASRRLLHHRVADDKLVLPALPFDKSALEPHMGKKTLEHHHGKHHAAYLAKVTEKYKDSNTTVGQVIKENLNGPLFNPAAQVFNHSFFWKCLTPNGGGDPSKSFPEIAKKINESFGSYDQFRDEFVNKSVGVFGSGWTWLVQDAKSGKLSILQTRNAETPLTDDTHHLILTCDVWEHAYYLDFQHLRPDYVKCYLNHLVNWKFATENLQK